MTCVVGFYSERASLYTRVVDILQCVPNIGYHDSVIRTTQEDECKNGKGRANHFPEGSRAERKTLRYLMKRHGVEKYLPTSDATIKWTLRCKREAA